MLHAISTKQGSTELVYINIWQGVPRQGEARFGSAWRGAMTLVSLIVSCSFLQSSHAARAMP